MSSLLSDPKFRKRHIMLLRRLSRKIEMACGKPWPVSYLAYDVETTGFSRDNDLIIEWGHCLVADTKIIDRNSIVLNWFDSPIIPADWICQQLYRVERAMNEKGRAWHVTEKVMRETGVEPKAGMEWIYNILAEAKKNKLTMVSHNGCNFDNQMLVSSFAQDLDKDFEFDENYIIDTGAVVKAVQMQDNPKSLPLPNESLHAYFSRIAYLKAPGVDWNLDRHCVQTYALDKDHGVKEADLHAAGADAYLLYLLMEKFRGILAAAPVPTPDRPQPAARPAPVTRANPQPLPASTGPVNYRRQRNR